MKNVGRPERAVVRARPEPTRQPPTSKPSPVRPTNRSSRLGEVTAKPRTPIPAWTSSAQTCSGDASPSTAGSLGRGRLRVGQAQPGQHLGRRLRVGGLHRDPDGSGPPQLGQRSLEDQPPGPHHADVRADLLHLGEQVRGDEHGGAVGGDLPDQRAHLAGPLRVEPVRRLVQDDQLARAQQARGDGQPLLHAQGVVAVPLLRRREQAHPVQGLLDPGPAPSAGRRSGRRRRTWPGCRGRSGTGRRPGLRPASRPGAGPGWHRPGIGTSSSAAWPAVGKARPSSILIVVVLPDPFGPRKP